MKKPGTIRANLAKGIPKAGWAVSKPPSIVGCDRGAHVIITAVVTLRKGDLIPAPLG
jgi:hypothetical protein